LGSGGRPFEPDRPDVRTAQGSTLDMRASGSRWQKIPGMGL
jgi:hypothetical protein